MAKGKDMIEPNILDPGCLQAHVVVAVVLNNHRYSLVFCHLTQRKKLNFNCYALYWTSTKGIQRITTMFPNQTKLGLQNGSPSLTKYSSFVFSSALSRTEASRASHACIPKDKHVFCRSHLDLRQKHELHAVVNVCRFEPLSEVFYFDGLVKYACKGICGSEVGKNDSGQSWTIHLISVNHVPRGSGFKRKWFKLLSGSDPPSACLPALFRNMYGFRSEPHCCTRKASGGLL